MPLLRQGYELSTISTCRWHPPRPPFDTQFLAPICNSKKKEIHVFRKLCVLVFVLGGRLVVFVASRLTLPKKSADLAAQLFRKLVNDLAAQCSHAMPGGKRHRGRPYGAAFFVVFSAMSRCVFCAGCPPSLRADVRSLQHVRRRQFSPFGQTERTVWLHWGSQGQSRLV